MAVPSLVVTEPEAQERVTVTTPALSSEKSLATVKVARLRVVVIVQLPTPRSAAQVPVEV